MKFRLFIYTLLISLPLLVISCLDKDPYDKELSSNPYFVSLSFAENDSTPGLEDAVFTLEADPDGEDSIIVNLDSLPYGTKVQYAVPKFYFKSTSFIYLHMGSETITLTGTDTIDFSGNRQDMSVVNISANEENRATYRLKINIHTVEPEKYNWSKISTGILKSNTFWNEHKIISFTKGNDSAYFYYTIKEPTSLLHTSTNLISWYSEALTNFPLNARLDQMTVHNSGLFVSTADNKLFQSANGMVWEELSYSIQESNNYVIHNLLFSFRSKLWALANDNGSYYIISSDNGTDWVTVNSVPEGFPIEKYSTLVFKTRVNTEKAIIISGAIDNSNKMNRWTTDDGSNWVNLAKSNNTLASFEGGTLIQYAQRLFLFGGDVSRTDEVFMRESLDQGLSWQTPDSAYNMLPDYSVYPYTVTFNPRSYISATISYDGEKIILVGGKDQNKDYSDVWTGRVNKIDFD